MTTQESKTEAGTPQEEAIQKLASLQRDIIEEEVESRCKVRFAEAQEQLYTDKKALQEERLEWEMSRQKAIEKLEEERELLASTKLKDREELEAASALVTRREEEVEGYKAAAERAVRDVLQEYACVNVGGKIFETTTQTLSSMSPYFARLLSGTMKEPMKDRDGNIFIDRRPEGFETFIEYARRGCLTSVLKQELKVRRKNDRQVVASAAGSAAAFTEEMEFYGIGEDPVAESVSPRLTVGMEVSIWWMRQRERFSGTVLMTYKTTTGLPMVWVKYEDQEVWLYDQNRLWYLGSPHLDKLKSRSYRSVCDLPSFPSPDTPFIHYGTASRWPTCFSSGKAERLSANGHIPAELGPHPELPAAADDDTEN